MTIKSISIKAIAVSVAISCSLSAVAENVPFKVAVIKGSTASKELVSGDLETSLAQLTSETENNFEHSTSLCATYLKAKTLDKSEAACTAAIDSIESLHPYDIKKNYLTSISYSNRAISRYLNNDFSGAIDDLNIATSINANAITAGNLKLMKNKMLSLDDSATSLVAD